MKYLYVANVVVQDYSDTGFHAYKVAADDFHDAIQRVKDFIAGYPAAMQIKKFVSVSVTNEIIIA